MSMVYALPNQVNSWQLNDMTPTDRWSVRRQANAMLQQLEDEIHVLRMTLESLVQDGQPMTSDSVIRTSMELDLKIVEYMQVKEEQPDQ